MGFVNGILLWGGLLAAIPVVIHLLNRRRFRIVEWAAMEWLLEARIRNRRRVRLENLLLLLIRAALLILLALLVSRPFLERGVLPGTSALGGSEHVVVLDDSMSMSVRLGSERPWDRAVATLGRTVERLRAEAPADRITVLRASRPGAPEISSLPIASQAVDELVRRLGESDPSYDRLRPAAALRAILEDAASESDAGRRDIVVITDLRRVDWLDGEDLPGITSRVSERGWPVRILDVGAGEATNVSLVSLEAEGGRPVAGVPLRLLARVINRGPGVVEGVRLAYRLGAARPPPIDVGRLTPGESMDVPLDVVLDEAGSQAVTVELDEDRLPGDDARHLAIRAYESVRVLVAAGEPFAIGGEGEADFLRAAISPRGGALSGAEVRLVDEGALESEDPAGYDLVVLVDVSAPSRATAERLSEYVESGGGLLVFVGPRVDVAATNGTMWLDGKGLLPAPLGDPAGDPARDRPFGVEAVSREHPLLRGFDGAGNPLATLLRHVRVYRRLRVGEPAEDSETIFAYGDAAAGDPAVLERSRGKGRVLLFTTTADRSWTSWPRNPTFLVLVQEILRRAVRPGVDDLSLRIGAPLRRQLDPALTDGRAVLRTPAWPEEPESEYRAGVHPDRVDRLLLDCGGASRPGIHEIRIALRTGETEEIRYAVNVEPEEGDLRRADPGAIEARLPGVEIVRDIDDGAAGEGGGRAELAPMLALLLCGLLLVESFVAWLFGHHTRNGAPEVGGAS